MLNAQMQIAHVNRNWLKRNF